MIAGVLSRVEDRPDELPSWAKAVCPFAMAVVERASGRVKYLLKGKSQSK